MEITDQNVSNIKTARPITAPQQYKKKQQFIPVQVDKAIICNVEKDVNTYKFLSLDRISYTGNHKSPYLSVQEQAQYFIQQKTQVNQSQELYQNQFQSTRTGNNNKILAEHSDIFDLPYTKQDCQKRVYFHIK